MMSDYERVTEVTHQTFVGRACSACCGVPLGLLLYAAAGACVWWNEGRAVFEQRAVAAAMDAVVEAPCARADAALEGRLIHVSCPLTHLANFTLLGGALRIDAAAFVKTEVEMFQWSETRSSSTSKDSVGGGTTTRTTYDYRTGWSSQPINSAGFKRPAGHANPPASSWPLRSGTARASTASVGVYALGELANQLWSTAPVPLPGGWPSVADGAHSSGGLALAPAPQHQPPAALRRDNTLAGTDGWLYSAPPAQPPIGAVRVRFSRSSARAASVVAAQSEGGFAPWEGDAAHSLQPGYSVWHLYEGQMSAPAVLARLSGENARLTWLVRLGALLVAWVGLMMVAHPISVAPDIVPCVGPMLGDMVGCVLGLAMAGVALCYVLVVGAAAWLRFRPLLGAAMLVAAALSACACAGARRASKRPGRWDARPQQGALGAPPPSAPPMPPAYGAAYGVGSGAGGCGYVGSSGGGYAGYGGGYCGGAGSGYGGGYR